MATTCCTFYVKGTYNSYTVLTENICNIPYKKSRIVPNLANQKKGERQKLSSDRFALKMNWL